MTVLAEHPGTLVTRGLRRPPVVPIGWLGEPRLLRAVAEGDLIDHRAHRAVHGPLTDVSLDSLLAQLDAVSLTGRGGAAFPMAVKLRSVRQGRRPIIVVNGCEGEPSSSKDTVLLSRTPHLVLDGAALTAGALGARKVLVAVTADGVEGVLRAAIASRPDARLFRVHRFAERFVTGEARALIAGLNGGTPVPPGRRQLPTERGVNGAPTVLSNAETYAQLAMLVGLGPDRFAAVGTPDEPGTTLITVTGAVRRPGVLEIPYGLPLGEVAAATGAGSGQRVVIGGYHGTWLAADARMPLSKAGLVAAGGTFGAGAVMFLGEHTCELAELARITDWLAGQSAKNCGPCAFGLPALAAEVHALAVGHADTATVDRHARMVTGRGACAHPDGAARFILSGLRALRHEILVHRDFGGCGRPDLHQLPLSRELAFTAKEVRS
ncbi:NADH-quinone oxidoreductase subunit NuoF family protein [soil metagenome]